MLYNPVSIHSEMIYSFMPEVPKSLARLQNTRSMYKIQLYFYIQEIIIETENFITLKKHENFKGKLTEICTRIICQKLQNIRD